MAPTNGILVHEWIETTGGAENVLDQFAETFPDAPIHCLWDDSDGRYPDRVVNESRIARTRLRGRKALAAPIMPSVWRHGRIDTRGADWMLISSHSFAHHILGNKRTRHMRSYAYVHTPARYIWAGEHDPRGNSVAARIGAPWLRHIDRRGAVRIGEIAANSEYIRDRIRTAWDRDAKVIYPPVAVEALQSVSQWRTMVTDDAERKLLDSLPATFVLGASRMVEYKRLDLVIKAGEAVDLPVVIAGSGPDFDRLSARASEASVPVTFTGRVSDEMLRALMQLAHVYVFPPVEDFGIMPVEAMTLGAPVVVNQMGGARESVEILGRGAAVECFESDAVKAAIESITAPARKENRADAKQIFGEQRFQLEVAAWVGRT